MPPDYSKLADAIFWAEGGLRCRWPYGIKPVPLLRSTARARCIAICREEFEGWNGRQPFIEFLARRYCEGDAAWIKNVTRLYDKGPRRAPR